MSHPQARVRLEHAARSHRKGMSANEFLGTAGDVVEAVLGVASGSTALRVGGALGAGLGTALGFRVRRARTVPYACPVGAVLLGVSCSFAEAGYPIRRVVQGPDGCFLEAKLPSNWATGRGTVVCSVAGDTRASQLETGVQVRGQLYDWGRGNRVLTQLTDRTGAYALSG